MKAAIGVNRAHACDMAGANSKPNGLINRSSAEKFRAAVAGGSGSIAAKPTDSHWAAETSAVPTHDCAPATLAGLVTTHSVANFIKVRCYFE
jgi:hypothetical protein